MIVMHVHQTAVTLSVSPSVQTQLSPTGDIIKEMVAAEGWDQANGDRLPSPPLVIWLVLIVGGTLFIKKTLCPSMPFPLQCYPFNAYQCIMYRRE
jgi:hypothetical protein